MQDNNNPTTQTPEPAARDITPDDTAYPREQNFNTLDEWWAAYQAWESVE